MQKGNLLLLAVENKDLALLLPLIEKHSVGMHIGKPMLEDVFLSKVGVAWTQ